MAREEVISYMNFTLRVEEKYDLPCRSIKGFEQQIEYDAIQEGGVNDYVHIRKKPVSKPFTVQIERYIQEGYSDPLPVGTVLTKELVLMVSSQVGNFDRPLIQYRFEGCTVIGKNYGELDAEKTGLLTETTTIAYERMQVEIAGKA